MTFFFKEEKTQLYDFHYEIDQPRYWISHNLFKCLKWVQCSVVSLKYYSHIKKTYFGESRKEIKKEEENIFAIPLP